MYHAPKIDPAVVFALAADEAYRSQVERMERTIQTMIFHMGLNQKSVRRSERELEDNKDSLCFLDYYENKVQRMKKREKKLDIKFDRIISYYKELSERGSL